MRCEKSFLLFFHPPPSQCEISWEKIEKEKTRAKRERRETTLEIVRGWWVISRNVWRQYPQFSLLSSSLTGCWLWLLIAFLAFGFWRRMMTKQIITINKFYLKDTQQSVDYILNYVFLYYIGDTITCNEWKVIYLKTAKAI